MTSYRLLLVEDRAADRALFRTKFEAIGALPEVHDESWIVREFSDVDLALGYLEAPPPGAEPNFLVCDLDFSGQQAGLELIKRAEGLASPVPSMVISQSSDRSLRSECLRLGALAYINKLEFFDYSPSQLRASLLDVVALAEARASSRTAYRWQPILEGYLSLGHDLLRGLDFSYDKVANLVRQKNTAVSGSEIDEVLESLAFSRTIITDFTESKYIAEGDFEKERFCARELSTQIVQSGLEYWRRRHLKHSLEIVVGEGSTCPCYANRTRVRRALENIIDNAVKFSPRSARISIDIGSFEGESEQAFYAMSVLDNGPGVPEDEREMIGRPLVRLQHTANVAGMGFGLYSCTLLMADHSELLGCANPSVANRVSHGGLEVTLYVPASPAD